MKRRWVFQEPFWWTLGVVIGFLGRLLRVSLRIARHTDIKRAVTQCVKRRAAGIVFAAFWLFDRLRRPKEDD